MTSDPVRLFVSYSHKDESYREALEAHLSPLIREGLVSVWYDRRISAGSNWDAEISTQLDEAEVHLLMVSPDFFASDYCYGKEMAAAIEKHYSADAIVLPVLIRPVDWMHSKLSGIQALPRDAIPITLSENQDAAWVVVMGGIREACLRRLEQRHHRRQKSASTSFSLTSLLGVVVDEVQELYDRDTPSDVSGITTGLRDLDLLIDGLHPGELTVVASAPSMDREGFLIRIASHVSIDLRLPVAFVCTQLDKVYIASRILTTTAHLSVGRVRNGRLTDEDWDRMTVGLGKAHDAPLEIVPAPNASVSDLLASLDQLADRLGAVPVIIIDSLAHFSESKGDTLRRLREYANRSRRAIIAGVGLESDPGARSSARPVMSDLGPWALVNEDFDCLMFLYFDQVYRPETKNIGVSEVIVARSRRGSLGTVSLSYLADSQCFESLTKAPREKAPDT